MDLEVREHNMKIFNASEFLQKKHNVFVLTHLGLPYFYQNFSDVITSNDIQLVVVDNGSQPLAEKIKEFPIYQSSKNLGCAGGWNLICQLAFNFYNLDKIIIGQDDALFSEEMVEHIWEETTDDILVGAYDRGFTYSLFGITKNFWNTVGMFDENFLYVTYEDNDYIHRINLLGKKWKSLNYSANLNSNMSSSKIKGSVREGNKQYMIEKWGHFEGTFKHPFDDQTKSPSHCEVRKELISVFGEIEEFPSIIEFKSILNA